MGTGQFCTSPGMLILLKGTQTDAFIAAVSERFEAAPPGTLLSRSVAASLQQGVETLSQAGAKTLIGNTPGGGEGYSFANTLLSVTGKQFLSAAEALQTEAFGNASLLVIADNVDQACQIVDSLEGNLTGCIYSDPPGSDDADYDKIAFRLRPKVGRLINDKMPTGVTVSAAMNHGGPYPATGHPGFTAVGIPASLTRFAALQCFDNVRSHRLPPALRDENPNSAMWRRIDEAWSQANVDRAEETIL